MPSKAADLLRETNNILIKSLLPKECVAPQWQCICAELRGSGSSNVATLNGNLPIEVYTHW